MIGLHRFEERVLCLLVFAIPFVQGSQVIQRKIASRIDANRLLVVRDCLSVVTELLALEAEVDSREARGLKFCPGVASTVWLDVLPETTGLGTLASATALQGHISVRFRIDTLIEPCEMAQRLEPRGGAYNHPVIAGWKSLKRELPLGIGVHRPCCPFREQLHQQLVRFSLNIRNAAVYHPEAWRAAACP